MTHNKRNNDIRDKIKKSGFYGYEVAEEIGISENTLLRWLRLEMSEESKKLIYDAIERLCSRAGEQRK